MTTGVPAWLWIVCVIGAAAVQTARNAMQRSLTESVGTVGATHVRFLFGLPFGLLFLAVTASVVDLSTLMPSWAFAAWVLAGATCQILGTALMLAAMRERSFVVTIAYIKTEPVQIALFGLVFLGEALSLPVLVAIVVATCGVLLMSMPTGAAKVAAVSSGAARSEGIERESRWPQRAALIGIASGAMFALSAVGFRGAILELGDGPFYARATTTLAVGLAMQTAMLTLWLVWRDRGALFAIFRLWRPSLLAGAAGALASQL
ncbi:MAG TPA: EamA family transporter, partial [Burkholderiaceae bacterium]|nr:EamA family transporter [Burkholderiaceae bacterium]